MMNGLKNISFTDIKQVTLSFLRDLKGNIKDVFKLPYAIHYMILAVVLTVVFIIITFPYEVFIRNQIENIEKQVTRSLSVAEIDFNIISDSYFNNVMAILQDGSSLNIKSIIFDMSYNPYTLLVKHNYSGEVHIKGLEFSNNDVFVSSHGNLLFDIFTSSETGLPEDGTISLTLRDTSIKGIMIQGFEIPPVKLKQVKYESEFVSKNNLKIKYIIFSGPDLKGNATGRIITGQTARNSSIDMTINIDSNSSLLDQYRVLLGDIIKPGKEQLTFTIRGPLANPRINLQNVQNRVQ